MRIRLGPRSGLCLVCLSLGLVGGCSDSPAPKARPIAKLSDFRKIRFANDWVAVPFRGDLKTEPVPSAVPGFVPKVGDRVVLSDAGDGEVFVAADLDSLKFYHSSPKPEQKGRFQELADEGRLFIVARGTGGMISRVVDQELPDGLRAIELRLAAEKDGLAWVSDPFVRRIEEHTK